MDISRDGPVWADGLANGVPIEGVFAIWAGSDEREWLAPRWGRQVCAAEPRRRVDLEVVSRDWGTMASDHRVWHQWIREPNGIPTGAHPLIESTVVFGLVVAGASGTFITCFLPGQQFGVGGAVAQLGAARAARVPIGSSWIKAFRESPAVTVALLCTAGT